MLLTITADFCTVIFEGPDRRVGWTSVAEPSTPQLTVTTSGRATIDDLSWGSVSIPGSAQSYSGVGPALAEETAYKVSFLGREPNQPLILQHVDPTLIADVRAVQGHAGLLTGSINFRSQVGRSQFVVVAADRELAFTLEVRPTKLDYDADYESLIDGVAGLSRQLVLEFLRATHHTGSTSRDSAPGRLDWLLLLRREVGGLDRALRHIAGSPHRQLVREPTMVPVEKIRRTTSAVRRALARGQGEGPWMRSPIAPKHRTRVPTSTALETLDNHEHRWLRQQLTYVVRTLVEVRLNASRTSTGRPPTARALAIVSELKAMEDVLAPHLNVSPLSEASGQAPLGFTSLTLLGKPGYREAYQSLTRLRMATSVRGEGLDLPVKDLSELYEIWCFVAVVDAVGRALRTPLDVRSLVDIQDSGIRLKVRPGVASEVTLKTHDGTVTVAYNRAYKQLTGMQKPDIVIDVRRQGYPTMVLVLDAKYRLDTSDEYVKAMRGPGPPIDAISQLHRYRDAITVSEQDARKGRPVVRAAALFPLSAQDASLWGDHRLFESIDDLGIGALPFLPSNTQWLADWVEHALQAPPRALAWPGPPFLGWEATRHVGT